ncbi:PEP-CTERM system histidine kinase PrsK [Thalassotalea sp. LPB0316]|uniref:XrtA/PEP-CTERM system histidine kinase PrsK n=1 Tax=Thalassotalea sp. LPB0316 TaxID=2769490 RepID=UPI0018665BE0|nr:XrtA/PEP-CTERM system histidine kinase PrsK [Thalassotalea sp. LPB0316]QOL26485.1 PEP-CTERM system histidine kinase PrsK [Thalassotalea sp. LPB0316]
MEYVGFIGYALAGLAYVVFALLLFAARNNSLLARWLIGCVLVTATANIVAASQVEFGFSLLWVMAIDTVKIACWAVLILSCNIEYKSFKELLTNHYVKQYLLVWSSLSLASYLGVYFGLSTKYLFLLFIMLNLWSLVLLEQLYRSSTGEVRWAIWPLVIAIAGVSLFDFVLYAQASMLGQLDFDYWYSRGFIAVIVAPLLLISTRRVQNGQVRVFVSRNVVFYSSMLLIAGLYLLIMAFAGYAINYFGGEWGTLVSVSFLMLGGVVLAALLMTESLRKQVKVFIAKNFFANKYEYREEWLELIEQLETTSAESAHQMASQIMMAKFQAKSCALIKDNSVHFGEIKFTHNWSINEQEVTEFQEQYSLVVSFVKQNQWLIDLAEYKKSPNLYQGLVLDCTWCEKQGIELIIPLFIGKAFYGVFLIGGRKEPKPLNWEDRDLIFAISKQLINYISLHEANDRLAESRQFDAFNRMSAFLVHDLKNVQAQLALINANAKRHRDNPEFIDDVFETIDSATSRLDKMLYQLRNKQVLSSKQGYVELNQLVSSVVEQCNVRKPEVLFEPVTDVKTFIDGETMHSVLNHLIQNAQEASEVDQKVNVMLRQDSDIVEIVISDSGCGMTESFIEKRLFKPFDTTKGNAGMGIGVYEAKQFIESLSGRLSVTSRPGEGSQFTLRFPLITKEE